MTNISAFPTLQIYGHDDYIRTTNFDGPLHGFGEYVRLR